MQDGDGPADGEPARSVARRLRILVVDDHHDGGTVIELLLRSMGSETMLLRDAENLQEAVVIAMPPQQPAHAGRA